MRSSCGFFGRAFCGFILFFISIVLHFAKYAIILNRNTKLSDQGLSALASGIKELESLTNLSLNFKYFNENYIVEFMKPFCEVPAAFWGELFVVTFCFLISVV